MYKLPDLNFSYDALEPYISEEQLRIHHQKHHQGYVNAANKILENINEMGTESVVKDLTFNIGGHVLHSLFWSNLSPDGGEPEGVLKEKIEKTFGSFENFKKEFSKVAGSVQGSGWAALAYCVKEDLLLISQIEKHNVNLYPRFELLMCVDVWEHAYYLDYQNKRGEFIDGFWNIVNWKDVGERLEGIKEAYVKS